MVVCQYWTILSNRFTKYTSIKGFVYLIPDLAYLILSDKF